MSDKSNNGGGQVAAPSAIDLVDIGRLEDGATKGTWGQFSATYGPWQKEALELYKTQSYYAEVHDSSHDVSAFRNGSPTRVATFKSSTDAAFVEALVNAYRAGRLVFVQEPSADGDLPLCPICGCEPEIDEGPTDARYDPPMVGCTTIHLDTPEPTSCPMRAGSPRGWRVLVEKVKALAKGEEPPLYLSGKGRSQNERF